MKQTYSINLGGIVFNIDDDAYRHLKDYLHQIETHFANDEEGREIMLDIESRIAELFQERLKGARQVIEMNDIMEIKIVLGNPDEFGDLENGNSGSSRKREKFGPSGYRRIYRDPDNRILGGVCSGMGAYWQIEPWIFRVIFIIFIFGAVGPIIYLILWIVIPEAKTAAQKLEMKGEPVNISNIGKTVKEEFQNVKDRMNL